MDVFSFRRCPKCKQTTQKYKDSLKEKVRNGYGKLPETEYIALLQKLNKPVIIKDSLKENFEFNLNENELIVSYYAKCKICKWTHKYNNKESIQL